MVPRTVEPRPVRVVVYARDRATLEAAESDMRGRRSIRILRSTTDLADVRQHVAADRPDVLVAEVEGSTAAIETCRDLHTAFPGLACVVLAAYVDGEEAFVRTILTGARAYVTRLGDGGVAGAVEGVARGDWLLAEAIADRLVELTSSDADAILAGLSVQERELVAHIAAGLTNNGIAEEMCLSTRTVRNYVSRLLAKLRVQNRAQLAAVLAYAAGHQAGSRSDR